MESILQKKNYCLTVRSYRSAHHVSLGRACGACDQHHKHSPLHQAQRPPARAAYQCQAFRLKSFYHGRGEQKAYVLHFFWKDRSQSLCLVPRTHGCPISTPGRCGILAEMSRLLYGVNEGELLITDFLACWLLTLPRIFFQLSFRYAS